MSNRHQKWGGGGDKYYKQDFTNVDSVVVSHNLGKYPSVHVLDAAETEYVVDVVHGSINQCTVSWNGLITGKVICS